MSNSRWAQRGQSTVEFAATLPVLIVVAVIAVNALAFLGECASFDRCARQSIRAIAAAPGYGQTPSMSAARIEEELRSLFDRGNLETSVAVWGASNDLEVFEATLEFAPTLFGMGMKQEVLGVALPRLSHSVRLAVEPYRPGFLL